MTNDTKANSTFVIDEHGSDVTASLALDSDARSVPATPKAVQDDASLLPIGEVVAAVQRLFPDVSHSSLRFLEREGLISPTRTAGGHRLFSPADLERIIQIKSWQAQRLSLAEIRDRLATEAEPAVVTTRFLEAMLNGDPRASQIVIDASEQGLPLGALFQQVLQPVMAEVGTRWASGDLRIGQEHQITEAARSIIAELGGRHVLPVERGPRVLAACVAGEWHDLGLRMISALLRSHGLGVDFLGANVSHQILLEEAIARRSPIVLLSATLEARLPAARRAVTGLRHISPDPPTVFIGGAVIEENRQQVERWGATPLVGGDLEWALTMILDTYRSLITQHHAAAIEVGS